MSADCFAESNCVIGATVHVILVKLVGFFELSSNAILVDVHTGIETRQPNRHIPSVFLHFRKMHFAGTRSDFGGVDGLLHLWE